MHQFIIDQTLTSFMTQDSTQTQQSHPIHVTSSKDTNSGQIATRPGVDTVKPKEWIKVLLIDCKKVRLMMFSLNMMDYPMSFLSLFT